MSDYQWDAFTVRIPVKNNIEALYNAWTKQHDIESWFVRYSPFYSADGKLREPHESIESGDTYRWRWHGWNDDIEEKGTMLECNGKDFIKFTFGEAGICSVQIKETHDSMLVELKQTNIPLDDISRARYHLGCKNGWTFYLTNLKSLFEGGIDLRNKNEQIQGVVNS